MIAAQMFCAEVVVAVLLAVYYGDSSATKASLPHAVAIIVIVFICVFVAAFAWSWGPLGWLVPSCVSSSQCLPRCPVDLLFLSLGVECIAGEVTFSGKDFWCMPRMHDVMDGIIYRSFVRRA